MPFQSYKLKYEEKIQTPESTFTLYRYGKTSICVSVEGNKRTISMAAHVAGAELPYDVKCGILSHLGMDLDREVEEYKISHPYEPGFGDTHYFNQSIDPAQTTEFIDRDDADPTDEPRVIGTVVPTELHTDSMPESLEAAIRLQAVAHDMKIEEYVAEVQQILDEEWAGPELEKVFSAKPTVWEYFVWKTMQQEERCS